MIIRALYSAAGVSCWGLGMLLASLIVRRSGLRLWRALSDGGLCEPPPCYPEPLDALCVNLVFMLAIAASLVPLLAFMPPMPGDRMVWITTFVKSPLIGVLAIWAQIVVQFILVRHFALSHHHRHVWGILWIVLAHVSVFAQRMVW